VTPPREALRSLIAAEADQPIGRAAAALVEAVLRRHGRSVAAVLFYGSCLRGAGPAAADDPVFDFYVLVDSYRETYAGRLAAFANAVLPPNVFYVEQPWQERTLRAKYAVVTLRQFRRGVSGRAFHSYFWARFAQPVRLAYARDDGARTAVVDALVEAVVTLVKRTVGLLPAAFEPAVLWTRAFAATYGAELRAEGSDRARQVYAADWQRYDRLVAAALSAADIVVRGGPEEALALSLTDRERRLTRAAWWLRRCLGKALSVLRLAKAVFTFDGGLDYILWKIERHSGVKTAATQWQRRHPLLAAPGLAWRLYRRGAFR
jgi:hypothetical protein